MILQEKLQGKTPLQKLRFLYRTIERLRLRHNEKGAEFRSGVITEAEWKAFLAGWEVRNRRVHAVANRIRENLGLFLPKNQVENRNIKEDGREAVDLDSEINTEDIQE